MGGKLLWYLERAVKYYFTRSNYQKEYGSFKNYCKVKEKYDRAKALKN